MKKIVLIKFGGSVLAPEFPDAEYLKHFYDFIQRLKEEYRFILITGGGGINKRYNEIAKKIAKVENDKLDWIGIYATRLNAQLLVSIFTPDCHKRVITDPTSEVDWKENILIGAGWKPGWSTDYDSMILAERFEADKVIVATNTDYVCDKDPNECADAKALPEISWAQLKEMVGDTWVPRMHIPLDPSAIRFGEEHKLKVLSVNGRDLKNMEAAIRGQEFKGTIIS